MSEQAYGGRNRDLQAMPQGRSQILPMQGEDQGEAKEKAKSKISNTYINKADKKVATPYLIKKKKNGKVIEIKANKQDNK
jgi:hypothetical protein